MDAPNALMNYPEWVAFLGTEGTYRYAPPEHPAAKLVHAMGGQVSLQDAVEQARAKGHRRIFVPVLYVEDEKEELARTLIFEPRLIVKGETFDHDAMKPGVDTYTTDVVLVAWPYCAKVLSNGYAERAQIEALHPNPLTTEPVTPLHFRIEALAWQKHLANEAWAGIEKLFYAMSLSEELWRLGEVLKHLPFYMTEQLVNENGVVVSRPNPRFEDLKARYAKQVGHLGLGVDKHSDERTERDWYADESPVGIDIQYAMLTARMGLPERLQWLINECRANGFKKVAELGSIEGVSLFHLIHWAPDIEWHGHEVSDRAVRRGHELAEEAQLMPFFHLHHVESLLSTETEGKDRRPVALAYQSFDAVALFEILEHNTPETCKALINAAFNYVRPGGRVYISTPYGNWSAFDLKTRNVELRKDHIHAFTPERMKVLVREALGDWACELKAEYVENKTAQEANGWVFASFLKKEAP